MKTKIVQMIAILICAGCIISLFQVAFQKNNDTGEFTVPYDNIEGTIYSSDGTVLSETLPDNHRGTVVNPDIYGALLGTNSTSHGYSGLKKRYLDILYLDNIQKNQNKNRPGNSLHLTVNHSSQQYAYNALKQFVNKGNNNNGAVVAIENKTGAVKVLVSRKAPIYIKIDNDYRQVHYNVNDLSEFDQALNDELFELPANYYYNEALLPYTPGSVFKSLSSVPIVQHGLENEKYNDETGYINVGDLTIKNYRGNAYGKMALREAIIHSANVHFSNLYENFLSPADLENLMQRCLIGSDIETDFGTLKSQYDISTHSSYIMSSFGQVTAITPVHLASLISSIAYGTGTVMKPFLVEYMADSKGGKFNKTKPEELTEICSEKVAKKIRGYLKDTAEDYGYDNVYMKTGTAQLSGDETQCWCLCANKEYTVICTVHNLNTGGELKQASYSILKHLTSSELEEEQDEAYEETKSGLWNKLKGIFSKSDKPEESQNKGTSDKQKPSKSKSSGNGGFFNSLFKFFKE